MLKFYAKAGLVRVHRKENSIRNLVVVVGFGERKKRREREIWWRSGRQAVSDESGTAGEGEKAAGFAECPFVFGGSDGSLGILFVCSLRCSKNEEKKRKEKEETKGKKGMGF
ncbi:hypothetical protein HAX54_051773, partial [Datura stramonium]|nr:hypothetical protein [Datura stramonium]